MNMSKVWVVLAFGVIPLCLNFVLSSQDVDASGVKATPGHELAQEADSALDPVSQMERLPVTVSRNEVGLEELPPASAGTVPQESTKVALARILGTVVFMSESVPSAILLSIYKDERSPRVANFDLGAL
jgi:hypothetical protein